MKVAQNLEYQWFDGSTIALDKCDSRLFLPKGAANDAPLLHEIKFEWERDNGKILKNKFEPELAQLDVVTGEEPSWVTIHDSRSNEDEQENQRQYETRILESVDRALQQIIDDGHDVHHRIDSELINWTKKLILMVARRSWQSGILYYQGDFFELKEADIAKDVRQIWWEDHLHWWHHRKAGGAYARIHIFQALATLIADGGVIGRKNRTALLTHDDKEDLSKEENPTPVHTGPGMDHDILLCMPYYQTYLEEAIAKGNPDKISEICSKIEALVLAVTKNKGQNRLVEAMNAARTLLEGILRIGLEVLVIKAAERSQNVDDIATNPNEAARQEIPHLTSIIYARLLRLYKMIGLYEKTLIACFKALNPNALENFYKVREARIRRYLGNYVDHTIDTPLIERLKRCSEHPDIEYIGIERSKFSEYADPSAISQDGYQVKIGSEDPMFGIYVQIKLPIETPEEDRERLRAEKLLKVRDYLVQNLRAGLQGGDVTTSYSDDSGAKAHISNPDLFEKTSEKTTLAFRINDGQSEVKRLRGRLREDSKEADDIDIAAIKKVLAETRRDVNNLLDELELEVLQPSIEAVTPMGEVIELPRGATPIDFMCALRKEHAWLLPRCRGFLIMERRNDPREIGTEVSPMFTLSANQPQRVRVVTEEDRGIELEKEWRLQPWWSHFCGSHARRQIHHALNRIAREKADDPRLVDKPTIEGTKKGQLEKIGHEYIADLRRILGFKSYDEALCAILFLGNRTNDVKGAIGQRHHLAYVNQNLEQAEQEWEATPRGEKRAPRQKIRKLEKQKRQAIQQRDQAEERLEGAKNDLLETIGTGRIELVEKLMGQVEFSEEDPVKLRIKATHTPNTEAKISGLLGEHGMNILGPRIEVTIDGENAELVYRIAPHDGSTSLQLLKAIFTIEKELGYPVRVMTDHFRRQAHPYKK